MKKQLDIRRGVNFGGWLSQCDYTPERFESFITAADFAAVASWGADHIRLPVDYPALESDLGWEKLDFAVSQCEQHGLKLIIDLHKARGFEWVDDHQSMELFSSEPLQEQFCRTWEAIAARYGMKPGLVYFELLNELTDPALTPAWNALVRRVVGRMRVHAPSSWIIVGSHGYNRPEAVPDLDAPCDDHIIYNFHCYDPFDYTHQGAYWVDRLDKSVRISFDASGATEEAFEELFAPALAAAEKYGAGLYCGEYGVIDVVAPEDAVKWFRVINRVFEKHGIARAVWNYRALDFGVADARWDAMRDELLKVL